jgi:hypothetical protein
MKVYKNKPVTVNAAQFLNPNDTYPIFIPLGVVGKKAVDYQDDKEYTIWGIMTPSGFVRCYHLDYIVSDEKGMLYTMKPAEFESMFEEVELKVNPTTCLHNVSMSGSCFKCGTSNPFQ